MGPTDNVEWRALLTTLRSIARTPAGTVKPLCSGGRANGQDLNADFKWKGKAPPKLTGYLCEHLPPLPPNSIALSIKN